jgi:hypothetical protein
MTDLQRSAAKMQSSESSYHLAYLKYLDCMEGDDASKCARESRDLSAEYHLFSKDISSVDAAVQNKNVRNNRDSDSVYIRSNDKISLGNMYRPTLHAQVFDYLTFAWIASTIVLLCMILVFL